MKRSQKFRELVDLAYSESKKFYEKQPEISPNPFYIGFGNPNSDVLIVGKEKGFNAENTEQLFVESVRNPEEWKHHIDNNDSFNTVPFNESVGYINAFMPYEGPMKGTHTWSYYSKLLGSQKNIKYHKNEFLSDCFITEVNYRPSKKSQIKKFNDEVRLSFLMEPFYRSFKTIVLACGNYLGENQIEQVFKVLWQKDLSQPNRKLVLYKGNEHVLVNTRQLSNGISGSYLDSINDIIRQ